MAKLRILRVVLLFFSLNNTFHIEPFPQASFLFLEMVLYYHKRHFSSSSNQIMFSLCLKANGPMRRQLRPGGETLEIEKMTLCQI